MLQIDFTQIDTYQETYDQCDARLVDAIGYIKSTIIPLLDWYIGTDKQSQSMAIEEIVSFNSDLTHLLKTINNLDINNGNTQHYHSEETQEACDGDDEIQCVP